MLLQQMRAVIAAIALSFTLSGCYVYAVAPPAPNGPTVDESLVGAWYGINEKGETVPNAFLHIIKPREGGPMHVVATETDDHSVYELHIANASGKRIFAVRKVHPVRPAGPNGPSEESTKYMLGVYDVKGDALVIRIFEPDKVRELVEARRVQGLAPTGAFAAVTLTGSPADVTRFLGSREADATLSKPLALARRLPRPR